MTTQTSAAAIRPPSISTAALRDIVHEVLEGREYPAKSQGRKQVNLLDLLADMPALSIAESIMVAARGDFHWSRLKDDLRPKVAAALDGSEWHLMRIEEMEQEAADYALIADEQKRLADAAMTRDMQRHSDKYGSGVRAAWE